MGEYALRSQKIVHIIDVISTQLCADGAGFLTADPALYIDQRHKNIGIFRLNLTRIVIFSTCQRSRHHA